VTITTTTNMAATWRYRRTGRPLVIV